MRRIHWKGWARTGRPIVREFEDVSLPHYALILDNFVEHGDENLLEDSISVAASFARAIDTRHNTLDLVTMKDEAVVVREAWRWVIGILVHPKIPLNTVYAPSGCCASGLVAGKYA